MKQCSKCRELKPATAEYFKLSKKTASGISPLCRQCHSRYMKELRARKHGSVPHRPLAVRFWEYVKRSGPDECWEWNGNRQKQGYGMIKVTVGFAQSKNLTAHRVAWELTHGPIPQGDGHHGVCVCHKCDNPGCVNPAHLFLGTHLDNMRDRKDKGHYGRFRRCA